MGEHHTHQGHWSGQPHPHHKAATGKTAEQLSAELREPTPTHCWCGEQHGGQGKYKYAGKHPWGPLPEIPEATQASS
jgi:hypothetical protein